MQPDTQRKTAGFMTAAIAAGALMMPATASAQQTQRQGVQQAQTQQNPQHEAAIKVLGQDYQEEIRRVNEDTASEIGAQGTYFRLVGNEHATALQIFHEVTSQANSADHVLIESRMPSSSMDASMQNNSVMIVGAEFLHRASQNQQRAIMGHEIGHELVQNNPVADPPLPDNRTEAQVEMREKINDSYVDLIGAAHASVDSMKSALQFVEGLTPNQTAQIDLKSRLDNLDANRAYVDANREEIKKGNFPAPGPVGLSADEVKKMMEDAGISEKKQGYLRPIALKEPGVIANLESHGTKAIESLGHVPAHMITGIGGVVPSPAPGKGKSQEVGR